MGGLESGVERLLESSAELDSRGKMDEQLTSIYEAVLTTNVMLAALAAN